MSMRYSNGQTDKKEWDLEELDDIFFERSDTDIQALREQRISPVRKSQQDMESIGMQGQRTFKNKQNFLKSIQSCLNWEQQKSKINEKYQNLIIRGSQPELIELNKLHTVDEHIEWKMEKDTVGRQLQQIEHERCVNEFERKKEEKRLNDKKKRETVKSQFEMRQKSQTEKLVEHPYQSQHMFTFDSRQTITIDLATADSQDSLNDRTRPTQSHLYKKELLLSNGQYSPSKASDSTADTFQHAFSNYNCRGKASEINQDSFNQAFASVTSRQNYRFIHTPSPTKMRRNVNLANVGDSVMSNQFKIKPEITEQPSEMTSTTTMHRKSLFNQHSPAKRETRTRANNKRLMKFKEGLMHKISINSSNSPSPSRYSDRRTTGFDDENSSPSNRRMKHLMTSQYGKVATNMLKNF